MVTLKLNQSNPATNQQCNFAQPIVNKNMVRIENVKKLLEIAQNIKQNNHESISH